MPLTTNSDASAANTTEPINLSNAEVITPLFVIVSAVTVPVVTANVPLFTFTAF